MTFIASDAILLVEDERILRLLTVGLLKEASYWVFCAENGEEAWGIFQDQLPVIDLLITEVVMPGMKGFDLTFCVRELNPELSVICVATKNQLTSELFESLQQSRDTLLLKPFDHDTLIASVKAALAR